MSTDQTTNQTTDKLTPEDLPPEMRDTGGIFYPTDHLVAAFQQGAEAERVRDELRAGGYAGNDCVLIRGAQMAEFAQRNLEKHTGFLARLGKSDEMVKDYLASAKRGGAFLLIRAPNGETAERAMNVIRRGPYEYVHRYHKLAIEKLK